MSVFSLVEPADLGAPADEAFRAARDAGVRWSVLRPEEQGALALSGTEVVIDALLGIGARGAPRGLYAETIDTIRDAHVAIVSADVPSGVDADTGATPGSSIAADVTVTFSAAKTGLLLQPGASRAGEIVVADVGVPSEALAPHGAIESWTWEEYARLLPVPRLDENKRSRGRLLIVGGAPGMTGAVCLAALGALRSGAGYVTVAVPAPSRPVVEGKLTAPVKLALPSEPDGSLAAEAVDAVLEAADAGGRRRPRSRTGEGRRHPGGGEGARRGCRCAAAARRRRAVRARRSTRRSSPRGRSRPCSHLMPARRLVCSGSPRMRSVPTGPGRSERSRKGDRSRC